MLYLLALLLQVLHFQVDTTGGLVNETMLHPADAFTANVLRSNEWGYNQALTPYPSWAWWGITDRITAELDLEAWLGGVPSFNFRTGIFKQKGVRPAIALETMFQYLKDGFDQFHDLHYLEVYREGSSWYNHVNISWDIKNNWHIHASGGITSAEHLRISNDNPSDYTGEDFYGLTSPDFSLALGWRCRNWISFHSSLSYGSTFLYADNIARKQQFVFAAHAAPFLENKAGFLRNFRFELAYLYAVFADAEQSISGPVGFLYWRWN